MHAVATVGEQSPAHEPQANPSHGPSCPTSVLGLRHVYGWSAATAGGGGGGRGHRLLKLCAEGTHAGLAGFSHDRPAAGQHEVRSPVGQNFKSMCWSL